MMGEVIAIPARRGKAAFVSAGQRVKVTNTHGAQVVDTWAFVRHDSREFMSMEHTRATLVKICPQVGDALYTNRRRPILTLTEDTSPGVHD
ncbi:MAG: urea carboxylase-associated family protein, partial [Gammaproteobacteria bacterium]|nr:urea carboxylase-associated family protein [Gammaproteobacteria bacterium]